jgi:hypothetical protein
VARWARASRTYRHGMRPRRGSAALLAAAAACLLLAGIAAYGQYAILDQHAFADRAASALQSDEVRDETGRRIAMRVVRQRPPLMPRQAAIQEVATSQIADNWAFGVAFRAAAARLHHELFTDANAPATLRVDGSGPALRMWLSDTPGWQDVPRLADPPLLEIQPAGGEGALRSLAPPARAAAVPVAVVFGVAGLGLLALGIVRAPDRRRGIWSAGLTVAVAAGLVAAGVIGATDIVLHQFDTGFGDAVVRQIWDAYLGDLRSWALGIGAAALVIAAAAGGPQLRPRLALAAPRSAVGRLARAVGLLGLAVVAVALPELVLHVCLVTAAAALVYVAAGELLTVLAPPNSSARRARAVVAAAVLIGLIAVAAVPASAASRPSWRSIANGFQYTAPSMTSPSSSHVVTAAP